MVDPTAPPDEPGDAHSRRPRPARRPRRPVRRLVGVGTLFLRRDTALVTAIAIATTLSAFAAYQATRAGEEADEAFSHARTLQAEAARDEGRLQTLVAHDSFLLGQYC